ncbi:LuxR C-terminal-related transcriptional regulator [Nocardia sp. NPDC057353]|uniref:LuxR C-terminal-related transcriptional regulator n=1 Tax=Nocardia sp. NPDC057353 TaxID=3346104 RepID=UPI00363535C5
MLRIGVVEDHESQIIGLKAILAETDDLRLVAEGATVAELLADAGELDLVVLDLRLGDGSMPEDNVARLRAAGVECLVVSAAEEPYLVQSAARAGVLGVLRKSAKADELVAAVRCAARGEQWTTMDWAAAIDLDDEFVAVKLSPREREVLRLYAVGESAQRVASAMGLALNTVNKYVQNIRLQYAEAGLDANTKVELYQRALEEGLVPYPRRFWGRRR